MIKPAESAQGPAAPRRQEAGCEAGGCAHPDVESVIPSESPLLPSWGFSGTPHPRHTEAVTQLSKEGPQSLLWGPMSEWCVLSTEVHAGFQHAFYPEGLCVSPQLRVETLGRFKIPTFPQKEVNVILSEKRLCYSSS